MRSLYEGVTSTQGRLAVFGSHLTELTSAVHRREYQQQVTGRDELITMERAFMYEIDPGMRAVKIGLNGRVEGFVATDVREKNGRIIGGIICSVNGIRAYPYLTETDFAQPKFVCSDPKVAGFANLVLGILERSSQIDDLDRLYEL